MRSTPLLLLLIGVGCSDYEVNRRSRTDVFLQEPSAKVDILWVIDNSASMIEEQQRVSNGFASFIRGIDDTNVDFHLGVISTDMDLDNSDRGKLLGDPPVITAEDDYVHLFRERVQLGTTGSDKERGLSASLEAISEPLASGANSGFLRADASLLIIYVSDENDCSDNGALEDQTGSACYEQSEKLISTREIIVDLKDRKEAPARVLASAIIGPPVAEACADSWPGARYKSVVEGLGGIVGDICDNDYSGIMNDLGLSVSGVLTTFQLSHAAVVETIEVSVDDELIPADLDNGWNYDEANWLLRFDGSYIPPRGATISVSYEVASGGTQPSSSGS